MSPWGYAQHAYENTINKLLHNSYNAPQRQDACPK